MSEHAGRRRRWIAVAIAAGTAVGATALATAPGADAGVVPATTALTSSAHWSGSGQPVTLTATVKILGVLPGLLVVPTGTVTFTTGTQTLGSGPIANCLLKTCTVTSTTTQLPVGNDTVTATYSGDVLIAGSSASTAVTVYASPSASTKTCSAGVTCQPATVSATLSDPDYGMTTTSYTVTAGASGSGQTVNVAEVAADDTFECAGFGANNPTIAAVVWSGTGTDVTKTVVVDIQGEGAQYMANSGIYGGHALGCYSSTKPFKGFVSIPNSDGGYQYANAPQVTNSDGTYYQAPLWDCASTTPVNTAPCYDAPVIQYTGYIATDYMYTIHTQTGDPKHVPT